MAWQIWTKLGFEIQDQFVGFDYVLYSYRELAALASTRVHLDFYLPQPAGSQFYRVTGGIAVEPTPRLPARAPVLHEAG